MGAASCCNYENFSSVGFPPLSGFSPLWSLIDLDIVKIGSIFQPIDSASMELITLWKLFWSRGAPMPPVCTVQSLRLQLGLVFPYYMAQSFRSCALSPFLWVVSFYIFFCPSESTIELMCSCGGMVRSTPFVCACISYVACTDSNNLSRSECIELSITVALHVDIPLYRN